MYSPEIELEIIGPDGVPVGVVRRPPPPPRRIWLHALLLGLTLLTTTLFGGLFAAPLPEGFTIPPFWEILVRPWLLFSLLGNPLVLGSGLAFSLPLLLILLTHELGHYLACRANRLDATLPYFLPVPFGIGTLGAFIRIRSPIATKRELLDVGASGPLAGFIVALPVLVAGIALSRPVAELPPGGYVVFGEPLVFKLIARILHPSLAQGGDLFLHPTGFAAWFGLLATALNLLPFGQLDGGHITYALFGRWQRRVAWPLLALLVALGFVWTGWWLWAAIALAMGVRHPWVPDQDVPLDPSRRLVSWLALIVFLLCFTPEPIRLVP